MPSPLVVSHVVSAQQVPVLHSSSVPVGQGWRAAQSEEASSQFVPQKLVVDAVVT